MAPRSRSPAAEYAILKRFATRDALLGFASAIVGPLANPDYLEHKSISEHGGKSITILYK